VSVLRSLGGFLTHCSVVAGVICEMLDREKP
jgi:hypothetical protein